MSKVDFPRELAVKVITQVLSHREPLDEALEKACAESQVTGPARAWLQEICAGTLRWKGRLDFVLDTIALKKKPSGWLRKALLLSAYQLVVQERTQPALVVSETVNEVRKREGEAPAKFANAVLRKIADHAVKWRELPYPASAAIDARADWASLPEWLWVMLVDQHGEDWAKRFALAALERPRTWIRARSGEKVSSFASPGPVEGSFLVNEGGPLTEKPGFSSGEFIVQDISSQTLVNEIAAEVRRVEGEKKLRALDLCAAPGGKAVGLAWQGFEVTASDSASEKRMELLRATVQRAAPKIEVVGPAAAKAAPAFDLVWVDAPCTGSGIIRRHPDVRWLRQQKDVASLGQVQRELLRVGWEKTRSGGWLAWSVCSVLREEGPEILRSEGLEGHLKRSWLLAPHLDPGGDGFWAALLQKP